MNNYKIAGIPFAFSHVYDRFFKHDLDQYKISASSSPPYSMMITVKDTIPPASSPLKYTYKNRHVHDDGTTKTIISYHESGAIQQRIDQAHDLSKTEIQLNTILEDRLEELEYVLSGLYFFEIAINEHRFPLHASAIEHDGEAILFSAPSGGGKSTHTAYWQEAYGPLTIINDDKPLLYEKDGRIHAAGTPFSGKESLSTNIERPVRAILFLKKGAAPSLRPLSKKEALKALIMNTFRPGNAELSDKLYTLCETIIENVPIHEATVPHSIESATFIKDALYKEDPS